MQWLVMIALAVFIYRQSRAIKTLETRLEALRILAERRMEPRPETPPAAAFVPPSPAPSPPSSRLDLEALRAAIAEGARPAVQVSNQAAPEETPPLPIPQFAPEPEPVPEPVQAPLPTPDPSPPPFRPASASPSGASSSAPVAWAAISTWLAENGLAWIGGGGLALGGLLLVVYAAQKGVFTPPLRIVAAVVLGGLMIAASEWILRQRQAPGGRHVLAAAAAAGAGAVTLYGAVCAAYALYHLIPFPVAAVLSCTVSLGLLGLALRHGQALALLAIFGAVLTPLVTGLSAWPPTVLQAWILLIGVTGFTLAAARRWNGAGLMTLAGLLLWSLSPRFGGGTLSLLLAATGPAVAVLWRRLYRADDPLDPANLAFTRLPEVALLLTSLFSTHLWFGALGDGAALPQATLVAGALVALGAAIAALGLSRATTFAAPVGVAVGAALLTLVVRAGQPGLARDLPWLYGLTGWIPAAALVAAFRASPMSRTTLLGVGGIGVAILASLAWPLLDRAGIALAWAPAAVLAAAMFATSALIARRVELASQDRGLALWLAAAAELAFLSIHAAMPARFEPVAFAAAALILGAAAGRLGWRGLAQVGVAGGLATLASLFHPDFIAPALEGRLPLPLSLTVSTVAAALLVVGARFTAGPAAASNRNEVEAQTTAALMVLLTGLFIGLHVLLAGVGGHPATGALFEGSMRTLLLLVAGLLLVSRQRDDDGAIARWRTVVVIGAGILHGLLVQALVWNPWWGMGLPPVGPPVVNTLILMFLVPAMLLALSAWRRRPADGWSRAWVATSALFAFLWALMAVRHMFHGAAMAPALIGRAETCAYAVLLLATARALAEPRLTLRPELAGWLSRAAAPAGWIALTFAALGIGLLASPWWGVSPAPLPSILDGVLILALQAAGAVLAWGVSRTAAALGRAALVVAFGLALVFALHLIRLCFHGPDMALHGVGRAEAAAYAVLALAAVRLLLSPRVMAASARTEWLRLATPALSWISVVLAALVFGLYASPWWGPITTPLASVPAALLLFALYALGTVAMAGLRDTAGALGKAATVGAVGILFALMSLLIRWVFHGEAMHGATPGGGLETWTFSALWAVFGLAALGLGTLRRDAALRWAALAVLLLTAGKVMLFDLARLEGVIRAASFLAVGALFLAGALAARRLNARTAAGEADPETPPIEN